ncbi:uncharacterized protein FOMMEDRAFT_82124, partial [Fomitiporia mediterranea MF3/22]|uniref:uncharacterized protein n=1 Tax=Fomitiporia mediterranea (strain MF3/22) TaxID=694068 RepID=UPI0004409971
MALLYYPFAANPQQLQTHRSKVPTNLALVLASTQEEPSEEEKGAIIDSVVSAVRWCKIVGIKSFSVYDRHGEFAALYYDAGHEHIDSDCSSDDTDVEYPPTPPLTDFTDSRPITPEQ